MQPCPWSSPGFLLQLLGLMLAETAGTGCQWTSPGTRASALNCNYGDALFATLFPNGGWFMSSEGGGVPVFMQQVNTLSAFRELQQRLEPPATATTASWHGRPAPLSQPGHRPAQPPGGSHHWPIPGPTWPPNPNGHHGHPIRTQAGTLWPSNRSGWCCLGGSAGAAGQFPQQAKAGRKIPVSPGLRTFVGRDFMPAPLKSYERFWHLLWPPLPFHLCFTASRGPQRATDQHGCDKQRVTPVWLLWFTQQGSFITDLNALPFFLKLKQDYYWVMWLLLIVDSLWEIFAS